VGSTVCDDGSKLILMAMRAAWKRLGWDVSYELLAQDLGLGKLDHIRATRGRIIDLREDGILPSPIEVNAVMQSRADQLLQENPARFCRLFDDLPQQLRRLQSGGITVSHTTGYPASIMAAIAAYWRQT